MHAMNNSCPWECGMMPDHQITPGGVCPSKLRLLAPLVLSPLIFAYIHQPGVHVDSQLAELGIF